MARTTPKLLQECHRLRRHLRELQQEIDLGPRVRKIQQATLDAAKLSHQAAHDELKRLKLKLKEDEVTLKQTETRLLKLQTDINNAGSKKEYDLKLTEIATATQNKSDLEDAILSGITSIEDKTAALPAAEAAWKEAQAKFAELGVEAQERLARMQQDQVATQAKLAETEAELPADMKGQYLRMVKQYGPDALAAVEGRTCSQCRTTITEQTRTSILSGAFIMCSQCGRGLYLAD